MRKNWRRMDLPIMLGKNLRKGVMAYRNMHMGGFDLTVLWLKQDYKTGQKFEFEDIEGLEAVLHFSDRESIEETINVLKWILKQWKERK